MQLIDRPTPVMVRGQGSYLWDEHGRRYLDFVQGQAANCLGHDPPALREALATAAVINPGPAYHNAPSHALAAQLAALTGLDQVFLSGSGAEANEAAVKLARKWGQLHRTGAFEVITTQESFHGRTLAMSSATGKPRFADAFGPHVPGFVKVPFGDLGAVAAAISARTVAVMVEPIQGEAGAVTPAHGYLAALRALCDRQRVLLIVDEVQTGMGRTGPLFAFQAEHVLPDLLTVGKGIGGGLPVSAVLARGEAACFAVGDHGGTFASHALLCTGALAVIRAVLALDREASSRALEAALRVLAQRHDLHLRGRGHLWGLVLPSPRADAIRELCFARGLLVNAARANVIRLMPALNVDVREVEAMTTILSAALAEA
ncbi:MAG TPA: aminotransferase class III-fold pyridoxal phosphate-dependent enzyme [Polyangiales bacterium]|nr:aminotransferase class III-fold pyridoxal phosphate-dependent enzyme [Polyangiales bacterium]